MIRASKFASKLHTSSRYLPTQRAAALTIALAWLSNCVALPVAAQPSNLGAPNFAGSGQPDIRTAASRAFPDFRTTGRSRDRVGGASRSQGACPTTDQTLTALAPAEAGYGGYTVTPNPTVWVYVPYAVDAESPITFALQEESGDTVYQTTFTATQPSGILGVELPPEVELTPGESYEWYFLVYCNDPRRQEVPAFTSGWIERVSMDSRLSDEQISALPASDRGEVYANNLIWYDAITALADALRTNPNDPQVRQVWTDLLELPSVQLAEFANEPIAPCCSADDVRSTID